MNKRENGIFFKKLISYPELYIGKSRCSECFQKYAEIDIVQMLGIMEIFYQQLQVRNFMSRDVSCGLWTRYPLYRRPI
eukprot:11302407-Ditylum_brightwellii.AAC.1